MKKILLIGCGHMGEALLKSWINTKKYSFTIVDPYKFKTLKKKYKNSKIKTIKSILLLDKFEEFNFIILATKPKDLNNALVELSNIKINSNTSLVSVIAGKKINNYKNKLKNIKNFFRVMPNMPAAIGQSMNCIVFNKTSSISKRKEVIKLFSYSGKSIFLKNENQIDMATAISGSGPGFVFNLIDAMEQGAIKLGFEKQIAKTLVYETFKGSINLLIHNNIRAKNLVKTVATKGGTTEAGLKIMKKSRVHKIFADLINEAYKKAKDQGQ